MRLFEECQWSVAVLVRNRSIFHNTNNGFHAKERHAHNKINVILIFIFLIMKCHNDSNSSWLNMKVILKTW